MADLLFGKPPNTFAEHIRRGKVTGLKYRYKSKYCLTKEKKGRV